MPRSPVSPIPRVLDVHLVAGAQAQPDQAPDLLIEVPHGATRTGDYEAVADALTSPLPPSLIDFFYVNTDAGAFELGLAAARELVAAAPHRVVLVLRCLIPRTFIDCNRRVDATPEEFREGRVTPGLMPWITTPEDRALLLDRYRRYVEAVRAASAALPPDGGVLLLHTYAPRSVEVQVDGDIVPNLRRAYQPEVEPTWPLRWPVDVIGRTIDGDDLSAPRAVSTLREALAALDVPVGDGSTYPLHPSTIGYEHVAAHPGHAMCLEVRRDLLADPFSPFIEMHISPAKVARLAGPLARALAEL